MEAYHNKAGTPRFHGFPGFHSLFIRPANIHTVLVTRKGTNTEYLYEYEENTNTDTETDTETKRDRNLRTKTETESQ